MLQLGLDYTATARYKNIRLYNECNTRHETRTAVVCVTNWKTKDFNERIQMSALE